MLVFNAWWMMHALHGCCWSTRCLQVLWAEAMLPMHVHKGQCNAVPQLTRNRFDCRALFSQCVCYKECNAIIRGIMCCTAPTPS
jgi:hypothetical protein